MVQFSETLKMLGKRVRELRGQLNLSIEELAFSCDLNRNYLADIENGKRNITLETMTKLAKGLQVALSELVDFSYEV